MTSGEGWSGGSAAAVSPITCTSCGREMLATDQRCGNCGVSRQPAYVPGYGAPQAYGYVPQPGYGYPPPGYGYPPQNQVYAPGAVAALVCGIIGVVLYFTGIILGPIAIAMANKARATIATRDPQWKGNGMAIAGLVCGIVGTVFGAIFWIAFVIALSGVH